MRCPDNLNASRQDSAEKKLIKLRLRLRGKEVIGGEKHTIPSASAAQRIMWVGGDSLKVEHAEMPCTFAPPSPGWWVGG